MKKIRFISAIIFLISVFVSLDLLINLLGSIIPSMNDGISVHGILASFVFGDDGWTHEQFFHAFVTSAWISFAVFGENVVLAIVDMWKK